MSIVDHEGVVEYPFSMKTVFEAVIEASKNIDGLSLNGADELSGRVTFKSGISLASWGENIPIQLVGISGTRTQMRILSTPKTGVMFGGAMDFGKNRQNIEKIINAVSKVLSTKPVETDKSAALSSAFIADELVKLKQLKDEGILTQEEFDVQKAKILAGKVVPAQNKDQMSMQGNIENSAPISIQAESSTSANSYAIIALIVFVVIFLFSMLSM